MPTFDITIHQEGKTTSNTLKLCDNNTCHFNPNGYCLAPLFKNGNQPTITENGCDDWKPNEI